VPASPYARRLAAERGIDLGAVRGSGPGGAVVAADLDRAPVPPSPEPTATPAPTSMRRLIAQRMATANREIPHYHLALDVDVTDTLAGLAAYNEEQPISSRILPAALYVRAVALALARQPEFNGSWVDDAFVPNDAVNVAMAISLRAGGLVTPHIEHADELALSTTMERLTELVAAARSGNLKARWMTGASITVTNLGDHGADLVHGVISPPQVALVGVGRTRLRPWVVDGRIEPRSITTLTLAADHRATDGMAGSRFLDRIAEHLGHFPEDP
jgi:pyruvate dehydrogenase E2 component (dihydrolipoamide acetyltransferase)